MVTVEHRDLRRDLHLSQLHQRVLRIAQGRQAVGKLLKILVDRLRGLVLVWKDQPETGIVLTKRTELLDDRSVTAGDRAVPAEKNQHDDLAGSCVERIHLLPVKIDCTVLTQHKFGSQDTGEKYARQQETNCPECGAAAHRICALSDPLKF